MQGKRIGQHLLVVVQGGRRVGNIGSGLVFDGNAYGRRNLLSQPRYQADARIGLEVADFGRVNRVGDAEHRIQG